MPRNTPALEWRQSRLQAQIRIFTINKCELDNFIKHFKKQTKPIHDKVGWPIVASWVNRPQNEFHLDRTYEDAADLEAKRRLQERRSRPQVSRSAPASRRWKFANVRWPRRWEDRRSSGPPEAVVRSRRASAPPDHNERCDSAKPNKIKQMWRAGQYVTMGWLSISTVLPRRSWRVRASIPCASTCSTG